MMTGVLIVTRTKDRNLLLSRAIKSVREQKYDDYTHVIINNGGDRYEVERVIGEHADSGRVKVIHSDKTVSRAKALNMAIGSQNSKYVAVIDDDDTWHPEFLSRAVDTIESRDLQGVVVRIDQVFEKVKANTVRTVRRVPWMKDLKVVSLYQQCIDNQLTTVGFVYTRSAYDSIGGYDESLNVLEDYEFGIRFLLSYDVNFIDPGFPLAYYHRRVVSTGAASDNSFASDDHRYNFYKIANRLLREELEDGRLGVGYIMSKIKYDQTYMAQSLRRVVPKFIVNTLKKRVQD